MKVLVFKISTHSTFEEPPVLMHSFINMSRYSAYGPIFSYENFDNCKIRMQAFLAIIHDEMVDVITTGLLVPMTVNPEYAANYEFPRMVIKEKGMWNAND